MQDTRPRSNFSPETSTRSIYLDTVILDNRRKVPPKPGPEVVHVIEDLFADCFGKKTVVGLDQDFFVLERKLNDPCWTPVCEVTQTAHLEHSVHEMSDFISLLLMDVRNVQVLHHVPGREWEPLSYDHLQATSESIHLRESDALPRLCMHEWRC